MRSPGGLVGAVVDVMGESDCEALGSGVLVQPVNALSSLAYVAVGAAIAVVALRRRAEVLPSLLYAAAVAAVGVGSFAYHGPQPGASEALHDLPILIAVIFIVSYDAAVVRGRSNRRWPSLAVGSAASVVLAVAAPALLPAAVGVVVATAVVLEVVVDRRGLRRPPAGTRRRTHFLMVGLAAVAASAWLLGHTRSPLCGPGDLFQFHGVWHVVSSVLFGLWWWSAIGSTCPGPTARRASDAVMRETG